MLKKEIRIFFLCKHFKGKSISLLVAVLMPLLLVIGVESAAYANRSAMIQKKRGGDLKPTEAELKCLPGYCGARIRAGKNPFSTAEAKRWRNTIGGDFIHVHHYCFALNCLNRIKMGKGDPSFLLGEALGNLDYMIDHVSTRFVLLPQIYYYKGIVLNQMGRNQEALVCFQKAELLRRQQAKTRTSSQ